MLNYSIEKKAALTVVFQLRHKLFEIPKFWTEWAEDKRGITGMFGFCVDVEEKDFDYWIADFYKPWEDIPDGCEVYQVPSSLWAQFVCRGSMPDSLQRVNTAIWSEWLPC